MKNSVTIKKETVFKLSTACITLFLTLVSFYVFYSFPDKKQLLTNLIFLFLLFLLFTIINLLISLRSVKKTELLYKENNQIYEKISNMSSQGIFLTTSRGVIRDLNIKAQSWFYEERANILGKTIFRNIDCDLRAGKKSNLVFYNDMGSHFQAEIQIKAIECHSEKHYVIFVEDQTDRINKENHLKKMASEDPLTGLLNRRSFLHELNKEIERSNRIGLTCTMALLDIDHFKNINDTYGHDFGDEVLKAFSAIIKRNSRQLDILCRYGGEEFVLLFPHTDLESSMNVLERIKSEFYYFSYSHHIRPTFSGGAIMAELKGDKAHVDLLLKEADVLLYKAKESGRNRIETNCSPKIKLIRVS